MQTSAPGQPAHRIDGRLKVTGAAMFAADNAPAGVAYGYLVTATIGCGTITGMDVTAAEAADGVLTVYTPDHALPMFPPRTPIIYVLGEGRRPLADHEVRYYGQVIGMVVAETFEQARDAAALIDVAYDQQPPRASFPAAVPHAIDPPPPFGQPIIISSDGGPGIGEALQDSEVTLTATYTQPAQQHSAMEAHAAVALWDGDQLTIYSPTQGPALHAIDIAEALGIGPEQVHVINPHVGGAFGGKATTWTPTFLAAAAARDLGRPVKVTATREQVFTVTGHRTQVHQEISLGARRDGTLTALSHESVSELVRENPSDGSHLFYRVPNISLKLRLVALTAPKATIMRAPGHSPGSFALECAMDELAVTLGLDPIELRMRNYLTHAPDTGLPYSSKHLDECYRTGAERFGWSRRNPLPGSVTDGDWLVGAGMATGVLPAERSPASARVRFLPDGAAQVAIAHSDLGTGAWTILAAMGARELGLPVDSIDPALGDSTLPSNSGDLPSMMGAVLSSSTATIATAVHGAATAAIQALREHAVQDADSPFHGLDAAGIRYEKGKLSARGMSMSFSRLLGLTGSAGVEAVHVGQREAPTHAFSSYAAYFCEVRVNRWTGEPRLSRMTAVVDAGAIVNQNTARNQIMGALTMGIGHALLEGVELEPGTGRIANANLADYLTPVNADVPELDVLFLDYPDTNFCEAGVRGLGELGCVGSAAAIANAIYNATGKRIRDLPITPDKLL
jgi:xanthine dehydrogenase YagR molybdenum-binding subunit